MKKILVVDDDRTMLKLAEFALSKNYELLFATSGPEAIRIFEAERPDMMLSDLMMPEMSGYELQLIIQGKNGGQIPFIFMTADESDESESKGFAQGAADYIRKPIKQDLLLRRVERIFQNEDELYGLRKAAMTDAMTGLLNKAGIQEEIGAACRDKQGVMMMIDLDSFKLVNDLYGHAMGDRILIRFSELIKSTIREDDFAGRMGGDEFVAFCQNLRSDRVIAEKTRYLNEELLRSAREYMGEDMDIPLGASVGAVIVPDSGTDYDELFRKADTALYQVKQSGKHGYALFQGANLQQEGQTVSGFESLRMIFGERNIKHGALIADKEQFQMIYRFLMRFAGNYDWDIRFAVFTLQSDSTDDLSTAASRFCELAQHCLRSSDVILKNSRNQVTMLLMKVDDENCEIPIARVIDLWMREGNSRITVSCESEPLNPKS